MQKLLLITSKDQDKKDKNYKNIYVGNWCSSKNINNLNIQYNWNSNKNFKKNYKYLKGLVRKFNKILAKKLNEIHGINKNQKFWEILLFPWITYYISAQFYRWKMINEIVDKNKNLYVYEINLPKHIPISDSLEFYEKITNSEYLNTIYFGRILNYLISKKKIKNIYIKKKIKLRNDDRKYNKPNKTNKFKEIIINFLNLAIVKLFKQKKILICEGLISSRDLIELNLELNQAPIFSKNFFAKSKYLSAISALKPQIHLRKKIRFDEKKLNNFEKFITTHIMSDMPKYLLEGYKILNKITDTIKLAPKFVVVFHEHYHNELFKFWYANNLKSTKLIVSAHGAAMQSDPAHYGLEAKIAHKKITYVNDDQTNIKKRIKLPFPKFIKQKRKNPSLLIYSTYISEYFPCRYGISSNTYIQNRNRQDLLSLKKNLHKEIYSHLKISNKLSKSRSIKNINNILGKKKDVGNIPFSKILDNAKLMICTYPQTTFLESIASGPTVALFNFRDWKPTNKNIKIYEKLILNNVFFESSEELSSFINKNWDTIDIWWNSVKEKKIIDEYINLFQKDSKYLNEWIGFFKKLLQNK